MWKTFSINGFDCENDFLMHLIIIRKKKRKSHTKMNQLHNFCLTAYGH